MPESAHTRRPLLLRALSVSLILLWLAVAAASGSTFGQISEVATNDRSSFLPESAESTEVSDRPEDFQDSGTAPAIVVVTADTDGEQVDPGALSALGDRLASAVDTAVGATGTTATEVSPQVPSEDGQAVQLIVLPPEGAAPADAVDALRAVLDAELPDGLQAQITGPPGSAQTCRRRSPALTDCCCSSPSPRCWSCWCWCTGLRSCR